MWPSISIIVTVAIVAYLSQTVWVMYTLFYPPSCKSGYCIEPYLKRDPNLKVQVYTSFKEMGINSQNTKLLWRQNNFDTNKPIEKSFNVTIPERIRKKSSLYIHILICPEDEDPFYSRYTSKISALLTLQMIPQAETFKLIGANNNKEEPTSNSQSSRQLMNHWHSKIYFSIMEDLFSFDTKAMIADLYTYISLTDRNEYLPLLYMDVLSQRTKDLVLIKADSSELPLTVIYSPISIGKLRFFHHMSQVFNSLKGFGFTDKDVDEVKGIFIDTNFYLLILTFVISFLHLLFDFLAFKNDINFWRRRDSMVGLSSKTVIWRCVSQAVIFVYLLDEETSLLVTVPNGIGLLIELWKLTKAFKITIKWQTYPRIKFGPPTEIEKETEAFDSEGMKYLSYALYPLCCGGAIYSLMFVPQKSWYSWCVHSMVNGVYAFGFLFMLPQLFVNYKLKSVAHLPWKTFMYKAFNTFIDDIFAFIITMPVAHRVACFRDDIVFVFYLYQRWLYPVDKSRFNEYGSSFEETKKKKKT